MVSIHTFWFEFHPYLFLLFGIAKGITSFNFRYNLDIKFNKVQAIRPRFILDLVYSFQVLGVDWIVGLPKHMI